MQSSMHEPLDVFETFNKNDKLGHIQLNQTNYNLGCREIVNETRLIKNQTPIDMLS